MKKSRKKAEDRKEYARSPTLNTIKMIEETIALNDGNRTEIWKKLPKKVMWQTYIAVLEYLESRGVIKKEGADIAYLGIKKLAEKKEDALKPSLVNCIELPSYIG